MSGPIQGPSPDNPFEYPEADPSNPSHWIDPATGNLDPAVLDTIAGNPTFDNSNYQPNPDSDPPEDWDPSQTADLETDPQASPLDELAPYTPDTPPQDSQN